MLSLSPWVPDRCLLVGGDVGRFATSVLLQGITDILPLKHVFKLSIDLFHHVAH